MNQWVLSVFDRLKWGSAVMTASWWGRFQVFTWELWLNFLLTYWESHACFFLWLMFLTEKKRDQQFCPLADATAAASGADRHPSHREKHPHRWWGWHGDWAPRVCVLGAERRACCESQCALTSVLCSDGHRWTQVLHHFIFYLFIVLLSCF